MLEKIPLNDVNEVHESPRLTNRDLLYTALALLHTEHSRDPMIQQKHKRKDQTPFRKSMTRKGSEKQTALFRISRITDFRKAKLWIPRKPRIAENRMSRILGNLYFRNPGITESYDIRNPAKFGFPEVRIVRQSRHSGNALIL